MHRLFLISCSLLVLNTYSEDILTSVITNIKTRMLHTQQEIESMEHQINQTILKMDTTRQEVARKRGSFRVHSRPSTHDKPPKGEYPAQLSLQRFTLDELEKHLFLLQAQKNIATEVQSSPLFEGFSDKQCTKLLHSFNGSLSPLLSGYAETLRAQANVNKVPGILQLIPKLSKATYNDAYIEYYFHPNNSLKRERWNGEVEILNRLLLMR